MDGIPIRIIRKIPLLHKNRAWNGLTIHESVLILICYLGVLTTYKFGVIADQVCVGILVCVFVE